MEKIFIIEETKIENKKKLFLRALLKILQIFVAPHWLFNN